MSAALLLGLGACASQPHNDVLVFGTDTKLAVDVSTPVAGGGTPEVTIGYSRREAVYMPLVVNGAGAAETAQNPPTPPHLYTGTSGGEEGERTDSYSVFASFGANMRGSRNATDAEAAVGLAQFFATGIAAQHLGANSRVAEALSIQPVAAATAAAEHASVQREREALDRLAAEIGSEGVTAGQNRGGERGRVEDLAAQQIEACIAHDATAFTALLDRLLATDDTAPPVKTVAQRLKAATNSADERRDAIIGLGDGASHIALQCSTGAN